MRIAFFTAGTIGAGHVARGIAIERALTRAASTAELTIVGPPSPFSITERSNYRPVPIDPIDLLDRRRAPETLLARTLRELAPDLLIVDLFWAPLLHILPLPGTEAWLIVRKVPPAWFVGPPGHGFDRTQFTRVIGIEPALESVDETIDPVVLVRPEEQKPRGALRAELGLLPEDRLIVVPHAAASAECGELLARVTGRAHVFMLPRRNEVAPSSTFSVTHHDGARLFPLAAWLGDADEIVTGAGYNAYWETRLLGLAARTTYVPFARPLDDQSWRIATQRGFAPRANGADVLVAGL